jgi:hypothetical protein
MQKEPSRQDSGKVRHLENKHKKRAMMMHTNNKFGFRLGSLALGLLLALPVLAADQNPDFSGVYRSYRDPAAGAPAVPTATLTPVAQAKVDEINFILEGTGETGGGWCLGYGMPASMVSSGGYPMEIIQRQEQITVIYEAHGEIRRVYIGDDNQIAEEDLFPDRNGYSKGWWEGDELVIETTHLKEQVDGRLPHSEDAKVLERYHQETGAQNEDLLVASMTLTDPAFYTAPLVEVKKWVRDSAARMLPYECAEPTWYERLEALRELKNKAQ